MGGIRRFLKFAAMETIKKMEKIILADVNPYQTRVALLENGVLTEYYVERPGRERLAGNIYKGVVRNVLPGMEAAFVDIGLEKNAFLYVGDVALDSGDFEFGDSNQRIEQRLIRQAVREGQELLVQVLKDPSGSKGARITMNITLPSRLMVMMPRMEYVGVSRRIEDEGERMRLKRIAESLRPAGLGLIIRTAAQGVSEGELADEIPMLAQWWRELEEKEKQTTAPKELFRDQGLAVRAFRDMFDRDTTRFIVNDAAAFKELRKLMEEQGIDDSKLECRDDEYDLFDRFSIESDIKKTLQRKSGLKSGGYLMIDHTEALTVIDVNTGKYVGDTSLQETIFHTNLEAAAEIARQIRLRDIGGIILIDFIDMATEQHREELLHVLKDELKRDRTRTNVLGITQLGLVEMTRKKIRQRVSAIMHTACPVCGGSGRILTPQSVSLEAFRQYKRSVENLPNARFTLKVHADVAEYLAKSGMALEMKNADIPAGHSARVEQFKLTQATEAGQLEE
jgi:ribonuclease G